MYLFVSTDVGADSPKTSIAVKTIEGKKYEKYCSFSDKGFYYSLQVMGDTQDKTDAYAALDQSEVDDYLQDILNEPVTCDCQE